MLMRGLLFFPHSAVRLALPRKLLPALRTALSCGDDAPVSQALRTHALRLADALLRLREQLHALPPLPVDENGLPRLLVLARTLATAGVRDADGLALALDQATTPGEADPALPFSLTASERLALPKAVALAYAENLLDLLIRLRRDVHARREGQHLAHRMPRMTSPMSALDRLPPSGMRLSALRSELAATHQDALLSALDEWLQAQESSAQDLADRTAAHDLAQVDELQSHLLALEALLTIDFLPHSSTSDPLDALLHTDPSETYAHMTQRARADLRLRAETLARAFHVPVLRLVEEALLLCHDAEPHTLESNIAYYLLDGEGLTCLRHSLGVRKGRLTCLLARFPQEFERAVLWSFSIIVGFAFLQGRQPLLLLPAFLIVTGAALRRVLRRSVTPPPTMRLDPANTRTLTVLPALLHDPHEAVAMVRRLQTAAHAFPTASCDFLLVGDPAPNADSSAIMAAAMEAMMALNADGQGRFLYLQREPRPTDDAAYAYTALRAVCRLIAQGECEDLLTAATFDPVSLDRRYAFVLSLTADAQPLPGMLEALLSAASHPLNTRTPLPGGWRGHAIFTPLSLPDATRLGSGLRLLTSHSQTVPFDGVGLIRPDAYLEATDGLVPENSAAFTLAGELAGCQSVPEAHVLHPCPPDLAAYQADAFLRTRTAWETAPWQLPWVQTPSGFLRAPLDRRSRFRLREVLRTTFVPVMQGLLVLWSLVTANLPLLLVTLLVPSLPDLTSRTGLMRLLACVTHLPTTTAQCILAILVALLPPALAQKVYAPRGRAPQTIQSAAESALSCAVALTPWAQAVAATLSLSLAIAIPGAWWQGLLLAVLFAAYPLIDRFLEGPLPAPIPVHDSELLKTAAAATWQFFLDHVDESTRHLPPDQVQFDPPVSCAPTTSPQSAAMYLLSCVSAVELSLLPVAEAAVRLTQAVQTLRALPMPGGLPCHRYTLPALTIADPTVDAGSVSLLLCALMTSAQAARTWLPILPPEHYGLPASLDALADALDLRRLYDQTTSLFYAGLDADLQGHTHVPYAADITQLLSIAAIARRTIAPAHMAHLSTAWVHAAEEALPLSRQGDAAAYLLPALFLPLDPAILHTAVRMQQLAGMEGLFGQSNCAAWDFTQALHYRHVTNGLPSLAAEPAPHRTLYAPYAAALALTATPDAALRSLSTMRDRNMLDSHGFCEAIDLTRPDTPRLIGLHDAYHQGILLCSLAHALCDAPLRRLFCAIPAIEATLPLLHLPAARKRLLPVSAPFHGPADLPLSVDRDAHLNRIVPDAQLMGHAGFSLLMAADGSNRLISGDLPLTRFDPHELSGLQVYLSDEGRVFRVTDMSLPGETHFTPGTVRHDRRCGSLRTHLTAAVDPIRDRALFLLEVTNLSAADRIIGIADCALPDLGVSSLLLDTDPESASNRLFSSKTDQNSVFVQAIQVRPDGPKLHHTMVSSVPPLAFAIAHDESAFLGRGRTLHAPASLEEPLADLPAGNAPCLSFRAELPLPGCGQVRVLFSLSCNAVPPTLAETSALIDLSIMQGRAALREACPTPSLMEAASLLTGPACFPRQPGPVAVVLWTEDGDALWEEVSACISSLRTRGMDVPLMRIHPQDSPIPDDARLVLHEGVPLLEQLRALYRSAPATPVLIAPIPAALPKEPLIHENGFGGFDPETGDGLVCLAPGMTTPAPWPNIHVSAQHREIVDEMGLPAEYLRLTVSDGASFTPFDPALPRIMRQGAGYTEWRTWTDALDITLTACCMPGTPGGLRVLRLYNATADTLTLTLHVAIPMHAPTILPGMAAMPKGSATQALTGLTEGWTAARCILRRDAAGTMHSLPDDAGDAALLHLDLTLSPHSHAEAAWLSGVFNHLEQPEQAALLLRRDGATALLRQVQGEWTHRLTTLTISTPDDGLDLLFNRFLPLQLRTASPCAENVPALAVTAQAEARAMLLSAATEAECVVARLHLALATAQYARITGDASVLAEPFAMQCQEFLLSLPLNKQGLPDPSPVLPPAAFPAFESLYQQHPAALTFLAALAATALHALTANAPLHDLAQGLCNAADIHLWRNGRYGDGLLAQALSVLADGPTLRTRQALQNALAALYDPESRLLRQSIPDETLSALPGTPPNGGQSTLATIVAFTALLRLGDAERAYTLLSTLSPLAHTNTPLATESYRAAPWLLPAGLDAPPARSGLARGNGSAMAGLLWQSLLEDFLGFRREGDTIRLTPNVPAAWDGFTLTLQHGASTWHFAFERDMDAFTLDGDPLGNSPIRLADDGKVHQVRAPIS